MEGITPQCIGVDIGSFQSYLSMGYLRGDGTVICELKRDGTANGIRSAVQINGKQCLCGVNSMANFPDSAHLIFDDFISLVGENTKQIKGEKNYPIDKTMERPTVSASNKEKSYKLLPEHLASLFFSYLSSILWTTKQPKTDKVVLAVPAGMSHQSKSALMDCVRIAGLNPICAIPQPLAFAVQIENSENAKETDVIIDFGASSFDVSIVRIENREYKLLASKSTNEICGKKIDSIIMKTINPVLAVNNLVLDTLVKRLDLEMKCEEAKRNLSGTKNAKIVISPEKRIDVDESIVRVAISKNQKIMESVFENALNAAFVDKSEIDKIILTGGSSLIPSFVGVAKEFFGKEPVFSSAVFEPNSLGASKYGCMIDSIKVYGIVVKDIGIKFGEKIHCFIHKDSQIPIVGRWIPYSIKTKKEMVMELPVYEGALTNQDDCELVGNFQVVIPPAPKGIRLFFQMEVSDIIYVRYVISDTIPDANSQGTKVRVESKSFFSETMMQKIKSECEEILAAPQNTKTANLDEEETPEKLKQSLSQYLNAVRGPKRSEVKTIIEKVKSEIDSLGKRRIERSKSVGILKSTEARVREVYPKFTRPKSIHLPD